MKDLLRRTQFLLSETDSKSLRPSTSEVAFIGRSNVGKSSLLNALCEHKGLADVSKMPGRTRKINVYAAAHLRWLIDLPGYGFSIGADELRKTWMTMIQNYLTSRRSLRAIFLIFNPQDGPQRMDRDMCKWLTEHNLPYILVGNKIDHVPTPQREAQLKKLAVSFGVDVGTIRWVSATHGSGISALRKEVVELLESGPYA